jgi:hypothetical protein
MSGLTLHNPRPRELDGDGSTSGGFVMEAAVLARRSSGAASLSTADAGVAGASGGFTGTGIATDGDSGAVVISSGSSGSGTGGDISVTVGSGDMSGGSFTLTGSASSGADGVSMLSLNNQPAVNGKGGLLVHRVK